MTCTLSPIISTVKIVPETSTILQGNIAHFLIILSKETHIVQNDIEIIGLPDGVTYTISSTGQKENTAQISFKNDALPIVSLEISIPPYIVPSCYYFTICIKKNTKIFIASAQLNIRDTIHFTHPGVFLNTSMLQQMKFNSSGKDPISKKAFDMAFKSKYAYLSYQPSAHKIVDSNTSQADDLRNDAISAYTQALLWIITGNSIYANNAIRIMNDWSDIFEGFTNKNRFNLAAWMGDVWPRAAEIIRYTYKDENNKSIWKQENIDRFKSMLKAHYIDFINEGFYTGGQYGGNLIASQAAAFINIGVFIDDPATFLQGVEKWRRTLPAYIYMRQDGDFPSPPAFWRNSYIDAPHLIGPSGYWYGQNLYDSEIGEGGISQETCRDLGHVMWGFSALANGYETARIQGFDLMNETTFSTPNTTRLSAGMEFNLAFLNNKTKKKTCLCHGKILPGSSIGKGEVIFNDLVTRRGLSLPKTTKYLKPQRPTTASYFMIWETLSHYMNP